MSRQSQDRGPRVNERIKIRQVRLIDHLGEQHGVVATEKAMEMARAEGLDLVEVADREKPPVCKIMDYGKFKYEAKRRQRENSKKQHKVELKQVRIRPKTGEHDYQVKLKHSKRFLEAGCKVQVNVMFRGRERAHTEIARGHLKRMAAELEELAKVEVHPKMEGFRMIMVMAPTPKALRISREAKDRRAAEKELRKEKRRQRGERSGPNEVPDDDDDLEDDLDDTEAQALDDSGDDMVDDDDAEEGDAEAETEVAEAEVVEEAATKKKATKKASAKKASTKKASTKKASTKKASTKKAGKKASTKKAGKKA